jgi:hypothetical protein
VTSFELLKSRARIVLGARRIVGYNSGMTTEQFRAILHQQPFRPFTIRMVDGRAFDVEQPDFVALSQSGRTVIITQPDENFSVLDLLLMSELQVTSGNGQSS